MFTEKDAESNKKGLTDKKQKQWSRIANSVLKKGIKKGLTEEEAETSAITQANGVVMNVNTKNAQYSSYQSKQILSYDTKLVVHQEKAHLVVPVVMMVEGVHSGSRGAMLHTMGELGKFPDSWNGRPVIIHHPQINGEFVSANRPDIVDKEVIGSVYNTDIDGSKLTGEIWIDEDKLNSLAPAVLESINNSEEMEVSLGMFTEEEEVEGTWNTEKYTVIAHNHRPDHLALLPDQIGACSCEDGCGIGANKNNEDMEIGELIKQVCVAGFAVNPIGNNADQGYRELMNLVYDKLRSLETDKVYCYLEEMYDDSLIYAKEGDNNRVMYKQSYKIESGKIEFVGEPIEVRKKVDYVVNAVERTNFSINNKKEDNKMSKVKDCPECLEKVDTLIANEQSGFTEENREWLLDQEVSIFEKLEPVVIEKEKVVEKTIEVNKLSTDDQAALAFGKKQMKERRETMHKGIQANTAEGIWTDEVLKVMSEDNLERLFNSVKKEETPDYSLNGNTQLSANSDEEEGLYPVGINFEETKK